MTCVILMLVFCRFSRPLSPGPSAIALAEDGASFVKVGSTWHVPMIDSALCTHAFALQN